MKHLKKIYTILIATLISTTMSSCGSDDDNGSGTPNPDEMFGYISVTITGAIEATHECENRASCVVVFSENVTEAGNTAIYSWAVETGDYNTFIFSINTTSFNSPVSRPTPGTYEIGSEMSPFFSAGYSNIEGGLNDDQSYRTTSDVGGTLVIESSSNEKVTGSFQFTAIHIDEGDDRTINVNGEFIAINEDALEGL